MSNKNIKGFTILEVVVALGILIYVFSFVAILLGQALSLGTLTREDTISNSILQRNLSELTNGIRTNHFSCPSTAAATPDPDYNNHSMQKRCEALPADISGGGANSIRIADFWKITVTDTYDFRGSPITHSITQYIRKP